MATCIRSGVSAGRLISKYNRMQGNKDFDLGDADVVIVIDGKRYSLVGGFGQMYEEFLKTKQLGAFTGKADQPKWKEEYGYKKSPLRVMHFDESFHRVHSIPSDCKFHLNKFKPMHFFRIICMLSNYWWINHLNSIIIQLSAMTQK